MVFIKMLDALKKWDIRILNNREIMITKLKRNLTVEFSFTYNLQVIHTMSRNDLLRYSYETKQERRMAIISRIE